MFEYDVNKSLSNKEKQGIDFEEAKAMWLDDNGIEFPAKSKFQEERRMLIAQLEDKIWSAIFIQTEENFRIISVRRARKNEKEAYYSRGIG